ncbi:hypothetical protein HaLaN_20157 [Haematococcus lacustris]|uniref:Uncharacterized protein n=1 Tax=Haematococcus lacustris TaxID=44745 RepID=A0A699ZSF1_HAELA|nr:hypothetical protein HaLaN_20157 [Haematococcus lacustris]
MPLPPGPAWVRDALAACDQRCEELDAGAYAQ